MKTDLFDFELPEHRIALRPCEPRDAARLLVVDPASPNDQSAAISDRVIKDLPDLLRPGDVLVTNDTRVIPAALNGVRIRGELRAKVSMNLIKRVNEGTWQALARPAKKLHIADTIRFGNINRAGSTEQLNAKVLAKPEAGTIEIEFNCRGAELDAALQSLGDMPIPPYIASRRDADTDDNTTYQTVFAARNGAVAAPTAGLHFTPSLLDRLSARGIHRQNLTLHVGPGTFLPVKTDDIEHHKMHAEWGEITEPAARAINEARTNGARIIAVGTTALRLLESAADETGVLHPFTGETDIFITPGYRFKTVDILITNFHLPRSTLFMLVSAFSGLDTMKRAYAHAVAANYRFYSYGDANLLFRGP